MRNIKKTEGKLTNNRAYGHYMEMAWLPFQKEGNMSIGLRMKYLVTGRTLSDQVGSFSLVPNNELHAL